MTTSSSTVTIIWHSLLVFGQGKLGVRAWGGKGTENELKLLFRVAADFVRRSGDDTTESSLPD